MTQTIDNKIIGFLGAGKMAEALTHGIISSGLAKPMQVITADKDASRLEHIKESYDIRTYTKAIEVAKIADILIIAVKPQDVKGLLEEIKSEVSEKTLIISIAAGITTDFILKALASDKTAPTVIRCMPNTPALLGAGAIGLFIKDNTPKDDIEVAENILNAVGSIVKVSEESLLDAVTGLSGSGPAYCFLFLKALTDAGVSSGLAREDALTLGAQTLLGSAMLAVESGRDLDELVEAVASPGGTTIEGLKALREGNFEEAVKKAVISATKKSKELSS